MTQQHALDILKSGKNVFLTGSAGTGKTYTLNQYIRYLRDHKVPVAITASTGIAATHMNGTTIHSWSGIGLKSSVNANQLRSLKDKKYLVKNLTETHILIIDEISMLHRQQLDAVNTVLKYIRQSTEPFGGMQVVFAGDFFQLPPVSRNQEASRDKMAFMSPSWVEAAPVVCYLTQQHRQSQSTLNTILNALRAGNVTQEMTQQLLATKNNPIKDPTRLYSHNMDVDRINFAALDALSGKQKIFPAKTKGNKKMMDSFIKGLTVKEHLALKEKAKVMFLKNNHEKGVMNGSIGEIIGFENTDQGEGPYPMVELTSGRLVHATPEVWSIQNEKGGALVSLEQVPLRLAWAITVHKSQGMTLDQAEVDLSKAFEAGQGYVALSRLKELDGLKLLGLNPTALELDGLAQKADRRFKELSEEAAQIPTPQLALQWDNHITKSGGTTDSKVLKKHRAKTKAKAQKLSTYEITLEYIQKNKSIEEIAEDRGMAISTIQGHVLHIADHFPETDLSLYRPNKAFMDMLKNAYAKLDTGEEEKYSKDGRLKSSYIYNELGKKYDYGEIKLGYAFIPVKDKTKSKK